ncbi:GOLPH3/VPS74 family protein [Dactylosporangium sp. CA-139114]|uniref:GOLPH3/VPS74 family protein n=1 Tax=Dactylosporangium sp. CA-139114 TaxID=3239931 RepID=UPI003D99065B
MHTGLADDFLLLALDDHGKNLIGDLRLNYGLAGAVLLDLALAGRIELAEDRVTVTDPTPTGDPVADEALARIAAEERPRKADAWMQPLADGLRAKVLDRQVEAGVLRREQDRVLWVFPRTRFASATGAQPAAETAVRAELTAAVDGNGAADGDGDGEVPARAAALIGLVQVSGLAQEVFPGRPKERLQARLHAITAGNQATDAVRQAVRRIQAVIGSTAAITAATSAATTAAIS